jgi:hypothetical protein
MTEPLLKILARFDINENPVFPLSGRAYLSAYNFEQAYNGDLVYAVKRLRTVVASPELEAARNNAYQHAVAIMWGDSEGCEMTDFLLWKFNDWKENGEINTIPVRDGQIILPGSDGSLAVTCEGGARDILHAEVEHRRNCPPRLFKESGPQGVLGLNPEFDFCTEQGRERLKEITGRGSYCLE